MSVFEPAVAGLTHLGKLGSAVRTLIVTAGLSGPAGDSLSVIFNSGGRGVSFQITVMRVLAGHQGGQASLAELKRCVAILTCSGADWSQRMKRLAARAPDLDIFSSGYVLREAGGWQITDVGRAFLTSIETLAPEPELVIEPQELRPAAASDLPLNVIQIADYAVARRGRFAA